MKKILFFFGFIFSVFFSCAQIPTFQWVKQMGGDSIETTYSIALDASGNIYTTGFFNDTADFDPGIGIFNLISGPSSSVFVSKLDASGNFVWAKKFAGNSDALGNSISVDNSGNVYTSGHFEGTIDFDPGTGVVNLTSGGGRDIFISKLDASGSFVWAKNIGGTLEDSGQSIVLDALGNILITGPYNGTIDFDPGTGVFNLSAGGIFILKLNSFGNFLFAKSLGVSGSVGYSIDVDSSGNIYTSGYFMGTGDFDPGAGTVNLTSSGGADIFISKLDALGNYIWVKNIGGSYNEISLCITVDLFGNIYTTGFYNVTVDFDPGPGIVYLNSPSGNAEIFVSKLDASGNFVWAKSMGGGGSNDEGRSIAVDSSGNVYSIGLFYGLADFDPGAGIAYLTSTGGWDLYISKLDASGNYVWAYNFGGTPYNGGFALELDALNSIYTTGFFRGIADFDCGAGTFNLTSKGYHDIFILKLGQTPVGIKENIYENNISIYPNPSNNFHTHPNFF